MPSANQQPDDSLSAHRVRSNVWPEPQLHPPDALIAAVEAVYDSLEDKT